MEACNRCSGRICTLRQTRVETQLNWREHERIHGNMRLDSGKPEISDTLSRWAQGAMSRRLSDAKNVLAPWQEKCLQREASRQRLVSQW